MFRTFKPISTCVNHADQSLRFVKSCSTRAALVTLLLSSPAVSNKHTTRQNPSHLPYSLPALWCEKGWAILYRVYKSGMMEWERLEPGPISKRVLWILRWENTWNCSHLSLSRWPATNLSPTFVLKMIVFLPGLGFSASANCVMCKVEMYEPGSRLSSTGTVVLGGILTPTNLTSGSIPGI